MSVNIVRLCGFYWVIYIVEWVIGWNSVVGWLFGWRDNFL